MFDDFVDVINGVVRLITLSVPAFRHFNNYSSLVLVIGILLGLNSTLAAPRNGPEWLVNPCSRQPQIRHGRSPAENQLRIFINFIDSKFIKELNELYKPAQNISLKGRCPKIKNLLTPIRNANTKTLATQAFYETLLQIALFIDKLKDLPVKTNSNFNHSKRKYIFDEAKENLRLVICEFNDTLSKYETKKDQPNRPRVPRIGLGCLPESLDITKAQLLDIDFFNKIKKFLKQSRRLLKKKKTKKANGVNKKSGSQNRKRTKKHK